MKAVWRADARKNYSFYLEYVHEGRWIPARHLLYVCDVLEAIIRGELNRLIIEMPPQHGKSMTVTESFPSYYLGKFPNKRVIEVSYGQDLAQLFGRRNKQKIEQYGKELFDIQLSTRSHSETEFELQHSVGSMISRGLGGGISGRPGNLIIIDDPVKNRKEADSEVYRKWVWDEWLNTIKTRLAADGAVIVIMTRWHEDDLAGRLLKADPGAWKVISLPVTAEENDPIGRKPGQALFPQIGKDEQWIAATKKDYESKEGKRYWLALYQCKPTPEEGDIWKRGWWRYYSVAPAKFDELIQSWDCSFKNTNDTSYVVGQVWGRRQGEFYLLDQIRARMDFVETCNSLKNMTRKWPRAVRKYIEDKANGPAIISSLRKKVAGLIPVKCGKSEGDKVARARAVSGVIESGNVYLPENAPWVHDFVEECAAFPNGTNNDQVDATSQALDKLYISSHPVASTAKGGMKS